MASPGVEEYHIGWICALSKEMTAAMAMLDERHDMLEQDPQDHNSYALGRIHKHNVVIGCLPAGVDGIAAATTVAKDMTRTFTSLRIGLMVGIGGGIPCLPDTDIRLGDVVVSQPQGILGGVVQYDKGKAEAGGEFVLKGQLNQPPSVLLNALNHLKAEHDMSDGLVPRYLDDMLARYPKMRKTGYAFPTAPDCLHCTSSGQSVESLARECAQVHDNRPHRDDSYPVVHYGTVASGSQVIKDAVVRDQLQKQFGAICVEMEAAGLMNNFPCIVIRGICDYADLHKNEAWHSYAAATAAAYAKELLLYMSPAQTGQEKPIQQIIGLLDGLYQNSAKQLAVNQEHLRAIKAQIHQNQTQYESDKHAQCHQTLKTSPYEEQKDINPDRVPGTCQWALNHKQYRKWYRNSSDDLLWISADPGCGKSVLAKSLVDHELQSTDTHTVCYFFFKDNEEQDSLATALCAVLHQLFSRRRQLIRHAVMAWEKAGQKLSGDIFELWRIWLAAARDPEANNVTCVLDAIDECKTTERGRMVSLLTDFYGEVSMSSSTSREGRLKFLVTSRPYSDIYRGFNAIPSDLPTIQLRGEEEDDKISKEIDLVIKAQVAKLAADLILNSQTKHQIETKLLKMEHRTYLWLHLATEDIYQTYRKSLRRYRESINLIPATVEQAYEKILSRINKEEESTVKQILQIVVGARRPLTINEMALALGVATSTKLESLDTIKVDHEGLGDRIRDWCGLFVFVNHSRIYLIHQTAKEFLVREGNLTIPQSNWKQCLKLTEVEKEMTRICVEFLCLKDIEPTARSLMQKFDSGTELDEVSDEIIEVESFLAYSAEYWPSHLRNAHLPINDPLVSMILQMYDTTSDLYSQWFTIFWQGFRFGGSTPQINEIQLAALLGHDKLLKLVLQRDIHPDINLANNAGRTALAWASAFGHLEVFEFLISRRADVGAAAEGYGTALQEASGNGHEQVVQLLLAAGADVNAAGGEYGTALQQASGNGHEQVVQLLLAAGADVNATAIRSYGAALQQASRKGHEQVVQLLLAAGADVNAAGGDYGTALQQASGNGHEQVVQLLLAAGADVNAAGWYYGTALEEASGNGHEQVVQLLLAAGADVNATGGYHGTALEQASGKGHEQVVQLLLAAGADVNATGGYHDTALQQASGKGHEQVVQLLLAAGADVNATGGDHDAALQRASGHGREQVVQLLLAAGADVNATGGDCGTALQQASGHGREQVVQLLLAAGADVNATGGYHGTALQEASGNGHEQVVQQLLAAGAVWTEDDDGFGSPL